MAVVLGRKGGGAGGGAPSGAAGGDLGGTYPNPAVAVVDDAVLGSGTPDATTFLRGDRAWVLPPGYEFDYAQITSDVIVASTNEAVPTNVISGAAVAYDGSTRVKVEFFTPFVYTGSNGQTIHLNLWDGSTDLGRIGEMFSSGGVDATQMMARFLTPSAATHTYHIKTWGSATGGSPTVSAGAGGAGNKMPAYLRITKA